jgi:hypothetical protein
MNTENEFFLDNSKRSTFVKCPYRYDLTYNRGITPVRGSTAMRYGSTFHGGMEGFYSHIAEYGWTRDGKALERAVEYAKEAWDKASARQSFYDDYKTFDNFIKSMVLYLNHFAGDEGMLEIVDTEKAFKIKMIPGVWFTGRLDLDMKLSGSRWINEFKTTGRDIGYIANQQNRDLQFVGYTYAMKRIYKDVAPEGILITYHQLSAYKSKKTGEFGEAKVTFNRIPQFFTEQDFSDWRDSFLSTAYQIQYATWNNLWPRQFDSCHIYGSCPYLFLCEQKNPRGEDKLAGEYFTTEPWDVLTTVPDRKVVTIL